MAACRDKFTISDSLRSTYSQLFQTMCPLSTDADKVECNWNYAHKNKIPRDIYCSAQEKGLEAAQLESDGKRLEAEHLAAEQKYRSEVGRIKNRKSELIGQLENAQAELDESIRQIMEERRAVGWEIVDDWYEKVLETETYQLNGIEYRPELYRISSFYENQAPTGVALWIRDVPLTGKKIRSWLHEDDQMAYYNRGIQVLLSGDMSEAEAWLIAHYSQLHEILSSCARRAEYDDSYAQRDSGTSCDYIPEVQHASR